MSYCVNCGVKLAESEKICPLCDTPVINPNAPQGEAYSPYPPRIEHSGKKPVNRAFLALLGIIILLIPISVGLIFQIISGFESTWPIYVYGGCVLTFLVCILPLYFKRPHIYITVVIDGISTALYIALIAMLDGGIVSWYLPLALPIVGLSYTVFAVCVIICRIRRLGVLPKTAIVLYILAGATVLLEVILAISAYSSFMLIWCWYVLAVFCILATLLFIINSRPGFADEIHRRLFA